MPHQFMQISCKKCGEWYCPVCKEKCPKCNTIDIADDKTMQTRKQMRRHMDNSIQITIPNKYHVQFKDGVIITRGKNKFLWFFSKRTLWLFTKEDWNKILITIKSTKNFNSDKSKLFYKILTSGIFKTTINQQGKIIIPNYLCKYANIKNDKIKIISDDGKLIIKTI